MVVLGMDEPIGAEEQEEEREQAVEMIVLHRVLGGWWLSCGKGGKENLRRGWKVASSDVRISNLVVVGGCCFGS